MGCIVLGSGEDAPGLMWRVIPTVVSKFHAAFTQGSEPDSLLLALHPGLDVFSLTAAANRPESPRLHGIALELSRSSLPLKE